MEATAARRRAKSPDRVEIVNSKITKARFKHTAGIWSRFAPTSSEKKQTNTVSRIMEEIRDRSGLRDTPRPCEYFNMIGGTSTGGIIAIMLGPLRMTVAQCLTSYKAMAARAFTPIAKERSSSWSLWSLWSYLTSWIPHLPGRPGGAFSGVELAEAVKEIVALYKGGEPEALFADTSCCKTIILAVTKANVSALPTKFRTYNIGDDLRECKIWEVARATSAATTFFPSISCGRENIEYIDAGFGHNNPTEVLISEAAEEFAGDDFDCVLSIGTGLDGIVPVEKSRLSILNALIKMASNSQAVHRRLEDRLPEDLYFRFNVTQGLNDISLSDWEESSTISAHARNYLEEPHVRRAIIRCATKLLQDDQSLSTTYCFSDRGEITLSDKSKHHQAIIDCALKTWQNLPPKKFFSNPVMLHTPTGEDTVIYVDDCTSLEAFKYYMMGYTYGRVEPQYRTAAMMKLSNEEFVITDQETNEKFDLENQRWDFIMEAGTKRYMSVKFPDSNPTQSSCPQCRFENATTKGPTICKKCKYGYERVVEVVDDEDPHTSHVDNQDAMPKAAAATSRKAPRPEPNLRLAFKRITLIAQARKKTLRALERKKSSGRILKTSKILPSSSNSSSPTSTLSYSPSLESLSPRYVELSPSDSPDVTAMTDAELEAALDAAVKLAYPNNNKPIDDHKTQSFHAYDQHGGTIVTRSEKDRPGADELEEEKIWKYARATSAATTFFNDIPDLSLSKKPV
ncbi:acyl transferase/acyl hydrolase/lysophospholipase [Halenospora varia]|nr:acyl transferase/acyl hydrolase/lysophospholipase [Halenospora varia]